MRLALIARRSVATLAATALVTSGGLVSGAFTGVALADEVISVTPNGVVNDGVKEFTVTSDPSSPEFYPSGQDSAVLKRNPTVAGQPDIPGTVESNSSSCTLLGLPSSGPDAQCGHTLKFTADMSNVAPGSYDVVVTSTHQISGADTTYSKSNAVGVAVNGAPVVTDSALYVGTSAPPDGKLTITGNYLTKGSTVDFLIGSPAGAPDPGLSFAPTADGASGYISATTLRGTYSQTSFTAGVHYIRVTNPIAQSGVSSKAFYQPRVNTITPAGFGQGAVSAPLTITGDGFNPTGSTLFIKEAGAATGAAAGITVGDITVSPNGQTLTTTLTVSGTAPVGPRDVTVRSADGGYFKVASGITINAAPHVTSVAPNSRGQGWIGDVTITGTGLSSATTFDFGPGITGPTTGSSGSTNAVVHLTIAPDASLGSHTIVATNPDNGTSSTSGQFTVTARPVITSLSPASELRGESKQVDVNGSNFVNGATLSATPAGLTITGVTYQSPTLLRATFAVSGGLPANVSSFDVTVTNPDGGTSTCSACFGVNSLAVLTTPVTNSGTTNVTIQAPGLTANSLVKIVLPSATDQGELTGTNGAFDAANGKLTVALPLTKAAAGLYTVTATDGATTLTCTACLNVLASTAPAPATVSPATGGAGATNKSITITGTGLSRGQTATFGAGVTTVSTTYDSGTDSLTAVINIASGATPGARDVTVTNVGQPASNGTKSPGFTVTAAPVTSTVAPSSIGQGGTVDVTLTGTGYQAGAVGDFGPGTTSTLKSDSGVPTTLVYTVSGLYTGGTAQGVTVTNPDGGTSTKDAAFTVTPAPVVSGITPSTANTDPTVDTTVTDAQFSGTGFVAGANCAAAAQDECPKVIIANVTVTVKTVSADGTLLVADLTVTHGAPAGPRTVRVINPDKGESTASGKFALVVAPASPPASVTAGAGDGQATVVFSGANGHGATITAYKAQPVGDPSKAVVVPGSQNFAIVTGLTNGTSYQFEVAATNDPAPASGSPDTRTYGAFSGPSNSVTPKFGTSLTSTRSPATGTAASPVTYKGVLRRTKTGAPLASAQIVLTLAPDVGGTRNVALTTNASGVWQLVFRPIYNTTVRTRFAGDADDAAVSAASYRMGVAPRISRSAPASGASSSAASILSVRGSIYPNKSGRTVGLYNGGRLVGTGRVASNGTFTINVRLPRGTYTLHIGIGATTGNVGGNSANFVVRRT